MTRQHRVGIIPPSIYIFADTNNLSSILGHPMPGALKHVNAYLVTGEPLSFIWYSRAFFSSATLFEVFCNSPMALASCTNPLSYCAALHKCKHTAHVWPVQGHTCFTRTVCAAVIFSSPDIHISSHVHMSYIISRNLSLEEVHPSSSSLRQEVSRALE